MTETIPSTLGHRLSEGRMPTGEALRCAMQIGEALRALHDSGQVHGGLTPACIRLTESGVELLPVPTQDSPYTAPEVAAGAPPDSRSDIFSFGAILFHMLTGDPPCAEPSTTGSRAADRAILPCLAASSALRSQRMQRVLMELKLLHTTVRRAEASRREPPMNAAALRAELQQMESRIAEQIAGQERIVEERYGLASDAISALATRMEIMSAELAGVRQWMATRSETEDVIQRILARLDREFEAVGEHFHRVEMSVEHLRSHVGELQTSVATDLLEVETNLKSNSAAIESARAAAAQTDDLVERVVEALESLQSAILDHNEGPADRADAAVN